MYRPDKDRCQVPAPPSRQTGRHMTTYGQTPDLKSGHESQKGLESRYWVERKVFAFSKRWRKHKLYCHLFKPF
jgi:hypothetical protein